MKTRVLLLMTAALTCHFAQAETSLEDVKDSSAQTANKVSQYSKEKYESTKIEMKKKIDEVDQEIDSLSAKAKQATVEQKNRLKSEIENLKNKKALLEKDFESFKSKSAKLWDTTKSRFEKLYQDIKSDIKATREENSL